MSVTAVPLQPVKSSYKLWLWCGIVVAAALAFGLAWSGTRAVVALKGTTAQFLAWNKTQPGVQTTKSGLQYLVIKKGEGPTAQDGDYANVSVEGRLRDGTIFAPSSGGMVPIASPRPGAPAALPGFMEAFKLMSKGEHIRAWMSPELAYGPNPNTPPELKDQVMVFDLEMKDLTSAAQAAAMRAMQGGAPDGSDDGAGPPPAPAPDEPSAPEGKGSKK